MTQPAGPDLNKDGCAATLTGPARQVHLAVLAAFAQAGQAPGRVELERIARAGGADPAAVLAELAERDVIAFGQAGEIRAAYPFSPSPTPIRVSWQGGPVTYAMCAIDALGISAMLGQHRGGIGATGPGDTLQLDPAGGLAGLGEGGQHRQVHLPGGPGQRRGATALVQVWACRLGHRRSPWSGWVIVVSHRLGTGRPQSRGSRRRRERPRRPPRRTSRAPGATGP